MVRIFDSVRAWRPVNSLEKNIAWSIVLFIMWLISLMFFMTSTEDHIRSLAFVFALAISLNGASQIFRNNKYQGYIITVLATGVSIIGYILLQSIFIHTEIVFAMAIIGISARWGTKEGILSAILAFSSNLTLTLLYRQNEGLTEGLAAGGFFLIATFIVGTQTQQRVRALSERAKMGDELTQTYTQTLRALVAALDTRDHETSGHSERVTAIAMTIAGEMNLDKKQIQHLHWGAILHDIGKIGIPDHVLKKPGSLTEEEWSLMRKHPELGYKILKGIPFLNPALDIVRYHHERFDGAGYPSKLVGHDIPLSARIFAVADTYDAMTSDRPYRKALSHQAAVSEISQLQNTQFDPIVVAAFLRVVDHQWLINPHEKKGN